MLGSGTSNSYYDEYMRKKGTDRVLHDPPALLTDRGAYVNFLEVQLERVSAACLGVQAYEQRFNDMQALIVALEQRCGTTTRMLGLSQQCTEELRKATFDEIEKLSQRTQQNYLDNQRMLSIISSRTHDMEDQIAALSSTTSKVSAVSRDLSLLTSKFGSFEADRLSFEEETRKSLSSLADDMQEQSMAIETVKTATSKQAFVVAETEKRLTNSMMALESRVAEAAALDRDEFNRRYNTLGNRVTSVVAKLEDDIAARETSMLANVKREVKASQEDVVKLKLDIERGVSDWLQQLSDDVDSSCEEMRESVQADMGKIEEFVRHFTASHRNLSKEINAQREALQSGMSTITAVQAQLTEAMNSLRSELIYTMNPTDSMRSTAENSARKRSSRPNFKSPFSGSNLSQTPMPMISDMTEQQLEEEDEEDHDVAAAAVMSASNAESRAHELMDSHKKELSRLECLPLYDVVVIASSC